MPIKVKASNSISFALTSPLLGPRSAALGWFSTLKGVGLVPYVAWLLPPEKEKKNKITRVTPVHISAPYQHGAAGL